MDFLLPQDASIVILTGAGISAESGLETFRGAGGLWCGHKVEDVATPEAFARNPGLVHDFYNMRRRSLLDPNVAPNEAHLALARLQKEWDGEFLLVTQNVDDLHERAGSEKLIHMHGEVLRVFCAQCRHNVPWREDLSVKTVCARCNYAGGVRPDIVWFGEMPYHMERIYAALENCDLFLAIGTSGNVYPAAGFAQAARLAGAIAIEANLEASQNGFMFHENLIGPAGKTIPAFVDELLSR